MENQIDITYHLVDKFLNDVPGEEVEALFKKIDEMDIQGPTVDEYMNALSDFIADVKNIRTTAENQLTINLLRRL